MSKEVPIQHLSEKIEILLACIRDAFPNMKHFSDDTLKDKIGEKRLPFFADELHAYIYRDMPVGNVVQRNAKLAEGARLIKLVQQQLIAYTHPQVAVTAKTVCEHLDLIDDFMIRTAERKRVEHESAFPGYAMLMA